MCTINHNVPANEILPVVIDNIDIEICEHCEENKVTSTNSCNYKMCNECLEDKDFLKCSVCSVYINYDSVIENGGREYLDNLIDINQKHYFTCIDCNNNYYTKSDDELLDYMGIETCTDPFEYYGLEKKMF